MQTFIRRAKDFAVSEDGPTATEYAVMLALIIVVAIAAVRLPLLEPAASPITSRTPAY